MDLLLMQTFKGQQKEAQKTNNKKFLKKTLAEQDIKHRLYMNN